MTLRHRVLPEKRLKLLRELLVTKPGLRVIEAHDGLSGLIGSTTKVESEKGHYSSFDALWVSSLTDSAAKGHPDTEVIDSSSRLQTIQEIMQVTNKPIIVDGDTGGEATQFEYFCSKLESIGVSAVVIEDKTYPKRNSLEADIAHVLEDPHQFAMKVNRGKEVCLSDDFMIFTRIESFIAGRSLDDAIARAEIYLDSKADGILIHSNKPEPNQIFDFMEAYQKLCARKRVYKPVICVPTTYNQISDIELFQKGFSIVIYANHLLRAAHKAMRDTCHSILTNKRSCEVSPMVSNVKEIMGDVGFYDVKTKDEQYQEDATPVVILASGKPSGFAETEVQAEPVSNIVLGGKPLLDWQYKTLSAVGLSNVTLISGYGRENLPAVKGNEIYNEDFSYTTLLHSLMLAKKTMSEGFIMIFGDLFFDRYLLSHYVLDVERDILLLVDNSFNLRTRKSIKSTTDLVIVNSDGIGLRKPNMVTEKIADIGNDISLDKATHEFIGIAKFSEAGAKRFLDTYEKMVGELSGKKDNKQAIAQLDFNAVIKKMIKDGSDVQALEVNRGWSEVHNMTDVAAIEKIINRTSRGKKSSVTI